MVALVSKYDGSPVDGDATERLWVEVRQLDLYFRKSLWCHIFNGGGGVGWRLMCNEDIFIPRYPPGVREGGLLYRCQVEQGSNSGTISWLCDLEQTTCLL